MRAAATREDGTRKGQQPLTSFFYENTTSTTTTTTTTTMGLSSNLRKPAIQKQKALAWGSKASKAKKQKKLNGGNSLGRVDEGTFLCLACEKLKSNPHYKRTAHHITCNRNTNYFKTNGGRISTRQLFLNKADEELENELKRPFSGDELHTGGTTQNAVDSFLAPTPKARTPTAVSSSPSPSSSPSSPGVSLIVDDVFSTCRLKEKIHHLMEHPTRSMRLSSSVPIVVSAAISLLGCIPIRFKKGTNQIMATDKRSASFQKLQSYQKQFPPGTIGFTFPRDNKTQQPDYYYSQLEGNTIYLVCWELNIPGIVLPCFECKKGELIHDKYDFQQHGYSTPIFDISGRTDWACSMMYTCNTCSHRCKGNDGEFLSTLPTQYSSAYPVDPRYATNNRETHISKNFSNVMDKLMITHGNGEQLSQLLHELRGDYHLRMEEEYYKQALDTTKTIKAGLPTFEDSIGRYSPSGEQLRDMKDAAAVSNFNSTGISDKDRCCREMQAVGANMTTSSDHTFAMIKNYN
jgi:hypothetical protein